ncbi:hypothetical protein K7T73_21440 (plasmid) [Bacillus badius]|uniref:IucA/IucC family protein n=1 Tax=Bacillus badius TaxID=1455 RepID=UPI001CBB9D17|nr:IucA/IucC family protein [Bacillus badius]UAT32861.1 hypothetical protein K7T73_21440 [Bacillus badius]
MHSMQINSKTSVHTIRNAAQRSAIERLLNTYLRETGMTDPRIHSLDSLPQFSAVFKDSHSDEEPMRIVLPRAKAAIAGTVLYLSPFGHHRYGESFWLEEMDKSSIRKIERLHDLAEIILLELSHDLPDELDRQNRVSEILAHIENSLQKTEVYMRHQLNSLPFWKAEGEKKFAAAEQALLSGHPFHPAPKSSQGFSADDLARYAPEMSAAFALHYFAAEPGLVEEEADETEEMLLPEQVLKEARQKLGETQQHYRLLPCHPWQAQYVKGWTEVQELVKAGKLVDLGPLANPVYPTSSVRTVWDPAHGYFFKLPLNVRITNFVRVNPPEQLKRTVDASRLLKKVSEQLPYDHFTVLAEEGYRTLNIPAVNEPDQLKIAESFAVIFRQNPAVQPFAESTPFVVAGLLEKPMNEPEPPLMQAIRSAVNDGEKALSSDLLTAWLERYLEIALRPLMYLFAEYGISLEAHVQNSMVTLQDGWPVHFYVRDLEGVSISQERAAELGYFDGIIDPHSAALYPDAEAWHRLKYYVLVNHFGHLLHTLAFYGGADERKLWKIVGEFLQSSGLFDQDRGLPYLRSLLEEEHLPAKANLISYFQKRGEKPLYVPVPNLLRKREEDILPWKI